MNTYPINYNYHPPLAPQIDDFRDLVLYATFNANEIVDQLRIVLDKNLNSKSTQDRILQEVTNDLIKNAWYEKLKRIIEVIRVQVNAATQFPNNQVDLSFVDELYDIIAFLQILGGLDPEAAAQTGIKHDFISAFTFMMNLIRKLFHKDARGDPWPETSQNTPAGSHLRAAKSKLFALCVKTIAELLNRNITYFESPESLTRCLTQMITTLDSNGIFANFLNPPICQLYDRIQVEIFKAKLLPFQIQAVIKSAMRSKEDIYDAIDLLPNDIRKFQIVSKMAQADEKYIEIGKKCVIKSNDVDVILLGKKLFPLNDEVQKKQFTVHFFNRLSELLSVWINELLVRPNPMNNDDVKKAYKPLHKIMSILNDNDRKKLFAKVKETELSQALGALVKNTIKELNKDDPMAQDILAII
ncbi:hypothetical protein TRFO_08496 [Tritrichomonas foetus]|uniref:Uncharacterized protein n=1 Tax=Tritrichomonas foetus TaxID=1144522 RepID=A0A1J4JJB8_9EUKA|nr:hypothetical protein TRFO_08496 [Tritrichomonas foetus]|eukprot:OHS99248.1 hypothetical protein TRFO_08496 [Tritrichomonas foetus]